MISINSCGFVEVNGYLGVDKKSPWKVIRIEKKQQKSDSFSRADEKRFCIGSAECYVTIINKTDAKVISSDTDDWVKTSFRQKPAR